MRMIALVREDDRVIWRVAVSKGPHARARQGGRRMAMMFSSEHFFSIASSILRSLLDLSISTTRIAIRHRYFE